MDIEKENELIEQSKSDPKAFEKLFDNYYHAVFRYAAHRTGNIEVSSDIAAETFFKAFNKIYTYNPKIAPFSAWLFKIANNETNYYFRKHKYTPFSYNAAVEDGGFREPASPVDIEKEFMDAQEEMEKNKDFLQVKEAICKLPARYQEVIVLKFLEDKKISEISLILNKKEGTIKSLISRGLARLRKYFSRKRRNHL